MVRLLRRGAPAILAVALVMALQGEAMAAPIAVSITNFQFTPASAAAPLNTTVTWTNNAGATSHTTTSDTLNPDGTTGIGLWDSGTMAGGAQFPFVLTSAGTYTYHCTIHPTMKAQVAIRPKASPTQGGTTTVFRIQVSQVNAPAGFVFDIQKKDPGGQFADWMIGITVRSANFQTTTPGQYQFRARMRRVSTNGASLYSPAVNVRVTA
jgi:plastocyanin